MKTLIVYYSLEGNTEYAAKMASEVSGADTLRLVPKKRYRDKGFAKFFFGGKSAFMGEEPELEEYSLDLSEYDRVVLGFPVWATTFAPPMRTFMAQNKEKLKGKRVSAFACQSGEGNTKKFIKLKSFLGIDDLEFEAEFVDPLSKRSDGKDEAIRAFGEKLKAE